MQLAADASFKARKGIEGAGAVIVGIFGLFFALVVMIVIFSAAGQYLGIPSLSNLASLLIILLVVLILVFIAIFLYILTH